MFRNLWVVILTMALLALGLLALVQVREQAHHPESSQALMEALSTQSQAEVVRALMDSGVYVSPQEGGWTDATPEELAGLRAAFPDRDVRIAVVRHIPPEHGSIGRYTEFMHDYLGLQRSILVVATESQVSAETDLLSRGDIQRCVDRSRPDFTSSHMRGIEHLVSDLDKQIHAHAAAEMWTNVVLIAIIVTGTAVTVLVIRRARRRHWSAGIHGIAERTSELDSDLQELRPSLSVFGATETGRAAAAAHAHASDLLIRASDATAAARSLGQLASARRLLDQAAEEIGCVRENLDRARAEREGRAGPISDTQVDTRSET
jgi:hypothetical protein